MAANVLSSADWQLSDAMGSIERKMQTAERTVTSLRQQLATAHILKGAIASAGADRSEHATDSNSKALFSFRSALQIPGHEKDLTTRELEAHQLRKLQMHPQALAAYADIEGLAAGLPSTRDRDILIARTKSFRAAILQAQASVLQPDGRRLFSGAAAANALLSPAVAGSALHMRSGLKPFQDWDLLEEAEIQYLAAFVAHNLNFPSMPQLRLNDAETAYNEILATRVRPWNRRERRELRKRAQAGLQRIALARNSNPQFDWRWLCSP